MEQCFAGKIIIAGAAQGDALVSRQPLSFWGGFSATTGEIIDRRHDLSGENATDRVLLIPHEKGSSTGSAILLDSIRAETAPAAIVLTRTPPILALGAIVADTLHGKSIPIIVLSEEAFASIQTGDHISIEADGALRVRS